MKKRQRLISVHQDIKSDPATLHNGSILGLVFDYLPTVDVLQCAQVSRRWTTIAQHYNKRNENKFKARYPEIYETIMGNNFVSKSWREEIDAVSQYEKCFPKSFLRIKNNKIFIHNWNVLFTFRDESSKMYAYSCLNSEPVFIPFDKDNVTIHEIIVHFERNRSLEELNQFLYKVSLNEDNEISNLGLKETNGTKETIWNYILQKEHDLHHLLAWAMMTDQHEEIQNDLVKQIVDVNKVMPSVNPADIDDCSLLHIAAKFGFPNMARILLEKGAMLDELLNGDGVGHYQKNITPLYIACEFGQFEVAKVLINHHRQTDLCLEMRVLEIFENIFDEDIENIPYGCEYYPESYVLNENCLKIIILVLKKLESSTLTEAPLSPWLMQYLLKIAQGKYPTEDEITQNSNDILQLEQLEFLIQFLCHDKPDLHLLCAIHAKKSENVIQSIVESGANVNGSEKYDIIPINYAFKFNTNAFFALSELGAYHHYDPESCTFDLNISCKS